MKFTSLILLSVHVDDDHHFRTQDYVHPFITNNHMRYLGIKLKTIDAAQSKYRFLRHSSLKKYWHEIITQIAVITADATNHSIQA